MLVKACLNGTRQRGDHPAIPFSPDDLATDTVAVVEAGAGAVHVHVRDRRGRETLGADDCGAAISAIRSASPGTPVGLTTGLWIAASSERRLQMIDSWEVLPDFCSVNFSEAGTDELCQLLLDKGIAIEAGLSSVADARLFVGSGFVERCLRILVEGEGVDQLQSAAAINRVLEGSGIHRPVLQHGSGALAWTVFEDAIAHGYDTRIGLEDTLTLPDGRQAHDNAALVAVAVQLATAAGARLP